MHAQAIDGSRQMQQTVVPQCVCMVHSFREEGSFIKYISNTRGGDGVQSFPENEKGASINDVGKFFRFFDTPLPPCWQFFASVRQQI